MKASKTDQMKKLVGRRLN